jgi:beta-galactosidase
MRQRSPAKTTLPTFPYGAVYFRKSNPPREDWARDYRTAAEDGMNAFRHWFLWSAIEVAPGVYDWADYDRQLDLAAEVGLKTVIAEMITAAPEWAFRQLAHARLEARDGPKTYSAMSASCVTGGFPGLCLDNDDARERAGAFLRALAERYRRHPALGAYDVWNECSVQPEHCYCPATAARFREWLKVKYGDLKAVGEAWHRHSYASWEDVAPPRGLGAYPDILDWLQFRIENAYGLMRWRVETIRAVDPDHPVVAHAHGIATSLANMADCCRDDWRAASEVEVYGITWIAGRQGNSPWKQWHALDLIRSASRGKPFWHAEAQGGPLWLQPQVLNRPREDGRVAEPEDIRLWNMVSFAAGATGLFYPRWRPLLDGPLFGAFGAYGMDGARTPRSQMVSHIAKWATAPERVELWKARPVKGDVGIVVVPESQLFCHAQQGNAQQYAQAAWGAYQGFHDNNIQADWVHEDDIAKYDLLYLPWPVMLTAATAEALRRWVENGGKLIFEGCPAYFSDSGRAGTAQPNLGLAGLFGARESYVEFTPDILDDLTFHVGDTTVPGGGFLQCYEPDGGQAAGWYADGRVAVVDNAYGRGRTRLIGTFPGIGYYRRPGESARRFWADLLRWAGARQHVTVNRPGVTARLHASDGVTYLWAVNHNREVTQVEMELSQRWGPFRNCQTAWGDGPVVVDGRRLTATIGGRDAVVVRLLGG